MLTIGLSVGYRYRCEREFNHSKRIHAHYLELDQNKAGELDENMRIAKENSMQCI